MTERQAIIASIKHWESEIELEVTHKYLKDAPVRCSLCFEYFRDDCKDCPIKFFTGKSSCDCTPYHLFSSGNEERTRLELDFLWNIYYAMGYK
jgi:hypothetical protein